jgi:hypothetical protein
MANEEQIIFFFFFFYSWWLAQTSFRQLLQGYNLMDGTCEVILNNLNLRCLPHKNVSLPTKTLIES